MVKAYAKTIGQPPQNTTSQVLIWVVLHSTPQGRDNAGVGALGRLVGDDTQWVSSKAKRVSIPAWRYPSKTGIGLHAHPDIKNINGW